mmetsp:Transcript_53402/g.100407  ORF Transcript_53402/g.100407 Transcript_53402/m.100407 type:complete len:253 (-) Transcript_53402:39-797(-)
MAASDVAIQAAGDVAAATIAAGIVAPFVAACDKAIAEAASGQTTVWKSTFKSLGELARSPVTFLGQPAFRILWVMYGGTYAAANLFTSYEEISQTSKPLMKTGSIFCVNASLSLWKDSQFAKLFSGKPPAPVPKPALVTWYARDFISMGVIFVAPPIVARHLHESMGVEKRTADVTTQFCLPLLLQPFVAPLHLYGYVLYNDPNASVSQQMTVMRREIAGAVQMRLARCVAPYSIGTNVNKAIRKALKPTAA